jgi:hypothetical protein
MFTYDYNLDSRISDWKTTEPTYRYDEDRYEEMREEEHKEYLMELIARIKFTLRNTENGKIYKDYYDLNNKWDTPDNKLLEEDEFRKYVFENLDEIMEKLLEEDEVLVSVDDVDIYSNYF